MESTTMMNATDTFRVLVGCPQVAGRTRISPIGAQDQGTGVSAFVIGGTAVSAAPVAVDPAFYAAPKSVSSDVAFVGPGRPPV